MKTEPLVLLSGMMCDARLFAPQVAEFSTDTTVILPPITQGERIDEIASNILAVLPNRFALAGLSMGGIVAMEILRQAPDRVTRLALMSTTPLAETPVIAANREPQIVKARSGRVMDVLRDDMMPNYLSPGRSRPDLLEIIVEMAQVLGPDTFIRQSRALQKRADQQDTLRKCKVPTLLLCGAHDTITPVKRHNFMADLIPNATLMIMEESGHLPTLEQPAEVNAALRDWMNQPLMLH